MGEIRTPFDGSQSYFSRHLSSDGLLSGTINVNGNYAAAATEFYVKPRAGESRLWIGRMIVTIEDTSGFQADEYGDLGAALSPGITVFLKNDTETLIDLTDGAPVITNAFWAHFCYDVDIKSWGTTPTDELLTARWTFTKGGQYIRVTDSDNERFGISVNESLVGLVNHSFVVQGFVHE